MSNYDTCCFNNKVEIGMMICFSKEMRMGYIQWHFWAENRYKNGWRQRQCKKCKHYHVWYKKVPTETAI